VPRRRRAGSGPAAGADAAAEDNATWKERLEAQEKNALQETLTKSGGNLTKGAELFGVPRTTYREKLVKHGLLKGDKDGTQ
jgi:DNA-binding NtrC family response regulator